MSEKSLIKALSDAEKLLKNHEKTAESQQPESSTFDEILRLMIKSMLICLKESVSKLQNKYTSQEEKQRLRYSIPYQVNVLLSVIKAIGEYVEVELQDEDMTRLLKESKRVAMTARRFVIQDRRPIRRSLHKL